MIKTILENSGKKVFQNESGANLLNGIASTMLLHSDTLLTLNYDYAIFEIDENTLPLILNRLTPDYLILLNLFRDQLDRYGEVNIIADKWKLAIQQLKSKTTLILNADDPQIAYLGQERKVNTFYFGLDDLKLSQKTYQHAVDSTYCPNCSTKLTYETVYYSHLGKWQCPNCKKKRPKLSISTASFYPLTGIYNKYNTNTAVLFAKLNNIRSKTIEQSLHTFKPVFGRQEVIDINNKQVEIFLSKNPTSFNESLRTVSELGAKNILFVLNDRIPDGRDVSWIWDVNFEEFISKFKNIFVSGDRCFDMALRIKYANSSKNQKSKIKNQKYNSKLKIEEDLKKAIALALKSANNSEILYILPTYSAMLEVRKILTGKKIL